MIGSPLAGQTVFSKFVWLPSIVPRFCRMICFKGLCFGLRAYAVRLEALRALGSRNLKGWKASGLEAPKTVPPLPPPPPPICLGGSPRRAFIGSFFFFFFWGGGGGGGGGGPY